MFIHDDAYVLVFIPQIDKKGQWTGTIDVVLKYNEDNSDDEKTKNSVLDFLNLTAACIELYEIDKEFFRKAYNHKLKLLRRNTVNKTKKKCQILSFPDKGKIPKSKTPEKKTGKVIDIKLFARGKIRNELL